jgi:O-antigen/teichoic acid export membrane protein
MTGGAVLSAGSRVTVAATGAATTIAAVHVLGPARFGAFAIAQTLIAVLLVLTTLGIDHGIVYFVSSGRWRAADAFASSQRLALVTGTLGAAAGLIARWVLPGAFHGLSFLETAVAAGALPFVLSWFYGSYVALATDRYEGYVLPPAIQSVLALVLVITLAALYGLAGAVVGFVLAHVITALVRLLAGRRTFASERRGASHAPGQLRRAASFGIRGYAANALQAVNYRADMFILNATAAGVAVGHYSVAVSVTSVMTLLPASLSDVLFPRVAALSARADGDGAAALRFAETKAIRHAVLLTMLTVAALAAALVLLVKPVYGAAFAQSTQLGLILLPGMAALAISNPFAGAIVGRGRPGAMLINAAIITPVTVVCFVLLIPSLHATGAALASSISYSATLALTLVWYRRLTGVNPLRMMLPTRSELADYAALAARVRDAVSARLSWSASSASANRL